MEVGNKISANNANWSFGGETAKNFDNHVEKSVPYYNDGHNLICKVSDFFVKNDSFVYEIGTSTGEFIFKLSEHNKNKPKVKYFGIDVEKDMINLAKAKVRNQKNINFVFDDALQYEFEKSDFIVAYYTVQFIKPSERQKLIDKIYESLNWGGAFLLFEKVRGSDARFQDIMTSIYHDYKLDQGFTPDEVVAKRRSLKGVLEPFSTQGNIDMLKRSGFEDIISIMKYASFEGFLAIK
jgi:tRNA (cmo5U34)-methyltransferase